jgi:hypothetical protein
VGAKLRAGLRASLGRREVVAGGRREEVASFGRAPRGREARRESERPADPGGVGSSRRGPREPNFQGPVDPEAPNGR